MIVRTFGPKGESLEEYSLLSHKCEPIMCDNGIIEDVDRIRVSKLKNTVETPSTYNVQNAELYD
ncbi:MAG: hypothetical protein OES34_11305 [Nitrosopumilus sp.]|nr:hypothetical protein [Nitrosopumilus sp.]